MPIQISDIDKKVLAKLASMTEQFDNILTQMNDPVIASNPTEITRLSKEHGKLKAMVEQYHKYQDLSNQFNQAEEMLEDPEMAEMAQEEIAELEPAIMETINTAKETLVMSDDAAIDSVIVEIRAGTGGDEAALFAGNLFTMYTNFCEKQGWKVEGLGYSASEMGGYRDISFGVKGPGVWQALGYEGGGHRVQRVPETESQGRIHTSAATVAVLPEPEEVDINIPKADVVEHVCRSNGPGGQSVNTTSSAIKLEHVPTGITVSMQDEKSQHKNRQKAWRILRSRVYEKYMSEKNAERAEARKSMIGSGDRSQRIRTYNFPQNRVTDHRINLSLYNLDKVIMGEIATLIQGLVDYDKQQRLENL
ncbi:MAG: peptide chain release factor 1 [Phycisphaerae bacterium]|nr:peptide chain release factor 1 [Phycisphaerae bacterium]